jgi:hypothetical protein
LLLWGQAMARGLRQHGVRGAATGRVMGGLAAGMAVAVGGWLCEMSPGRVRRAQCLPRTSAETPRLLT